MIPPIYVFTSTMTNKMIFQVDSWLINDKILHFIRFHDLELFEQHLYPYFQTRCIRYNNVLSFTRWKSHNALFSWAPRYWGTFNHEYVACNTLLLILISTEVLVSVTMYFCICPVILLPYYQHTMINCTTYISRHSLDCSEMRLLWLLHEYTQQPDTFSMKSPSVSIAWFGNISYLTSLIDSVLALVDLLIFCSSGSSFRVVVASILWSSSSTVVNVSFSCQTNPQC